MMQELALFSPLKLVCFSREERPAPPYFLEPRLQATLSMIGPGNKGSLLGISTHLDKLICLWERK